MMDPLTMDPAGAAEASPEVAPRDPDPTACTGFWSYVPGVTCTAPDPASLEGKPAFCDPTSLAWWGSALWDPAEHRRVCGDDNSPPPEADGQGVADFLSFAQSTTTLVAVALGLVVVAYIAGKVT